MTYAIAFDLDTEMLKQIYSGNHYNNAYADIRTVLAEHGFIPQQGSLYFGVGESKRSNLCFSLTRASKKIYLV